ncbi:MAG: class I SAM-dependent methyltransferase [Bacteroidota bacterium]
MNRVQLIQKVFSNTHFNTYLEIGTRSGNSFLPIKSKTKIAVDPEFTIPWEKKAKWMIKNPSNFGSKYFEETSDDFFRLRKGFLKKTGKIDVVLIDGLHTYQASLNDVLNALVFLNSNGVIVLHDCLPPHEAAALPTRNYPTKEEQNIEGWDGQWNGDVWKTIVYLRRHFSDLLEVLVLNTDYGLGIVRMKCRIDEKPVIDQASFDEIDRMTYREMIPNATEILNVKDVGYITPLLKEIASQPDPC